MKVPEDKVIAFNEKLIHAKYDVMNLLGLNVAEKSPVELEEEWTKIQ